MKEVKKCSISGIAFTMEADAFQVLSRYLESLNDTYRNTDGGKEIVEDIEARIAERTYYSDVGFFENTSCWNL